MEGLQVRALKQKHVLIVCDSIELYIKVLGFFKPKVYFHDDGSHIFNIYIQDLCNLLGTPCDSFCGVKFK